VLHIRDVTERLLVEERMRRMERFMGLGALAAGLHHEIKNPLGALSLHVQLLEERLGDRADNEAAESLGVLKTEVTRISGVLESFRDFASVERLNRTDADLPELVRQTVDLIRPQAEGQGVRLTLKLPKEELPSLAADEARLEQVLLNLVMNALEEMESGGELTLSLRRNDDRLQIDVADTGRGIPERIQSRVFDPYFTTKTTGSGMGLAFCDKIIRQHGGQIDFETSSAGTTFRVVLFLDSD
jgi:two-component system nitrogen regulation sensor histidine kinase GlnL